MALRDNRKHNMLTHYIKTLFQYAGIRAWISLGLMVFLGLTQGVGLLMLIPFLRLIGLGGGEGPGGLATYIGNAFAWVGLPLTIPSILCVYVGIVAAHAMVTRYREVLNTKIIYGFTQVLRNSLYQAFCRTEWLCFMRTRGSDITHVLTSDLQRVGFATQQLLQLAGTIIIAGVHIAVALIISVPMTLFALACGGGFLLVLRPFNRQSNIFGRRLRGSMNDMYSAVTEHLGGMKIAKSYSLEDQHEQNFRNITNGVTDQMVRFTRVNAATRMYYEVGAAAALAAFFFVAVEMAHMPAANLLLIVFLFARLLPRFSMIQQCVQRIANALPSFEAALEMEKRFEKMKEPLPMTTASPLKLNREILFSSVSFRYDKNSDIWALRNVDLVIPARGTTAIVGPSGAGKSTMADLILGLLSPEQGTISINGKPLTEELLHRWRRSVGYAPQDTFLFHDTIRANLLCALPDAKDSDLQLALRLAAADQFVSRIPEGLDAVVGDRGVRLSGGERQRIALARALLRKPSLLLLDEATSSIDTESERRIQEVIDKLRGELTMVIIAHRPSTIRRADRIIVLDHSRIVEKGKWQELMDLPKGRLRSMIR
jgi:ATP-binding cassette subfamily C protein